MADDAHNAGGAESFNEGVTINPSEADVLFGKGYRLQLHRGNIRFREFLEQHKDNYENTANLLDFLRT